MENGKKSIIPVCTIYNLKLEVDADVLHVCIGTVCQLWALGGVSWDLSAHLEQRRITATPLKAASVAMLIVNVREESGRGMPSTK